MSIKYTFIAALLLSLYSNWGRAQIIETVAGDGAYTYNGDSLAATAAAFQPVGLAFSPKGELYFSTDNNKIRKITKSGIVVTVANAISFGGFNGNDIPATAAKLDAPNGNLFFCDANNDQIRMIDTLGIIHLVAGLDTGGGWGGGYNGDNQPATGARLSMPQSLVIKSDYSIIFSDGANNRIRKISPTGIITTLASIADSAMVVFPIGITLDKWENIYYCNYGSNVIMKIDTAGVITHFAGNGSHVAIAGIGGPADSACIPGPSDLKIDAVGNMYVSTGAHAQVLMIDTAKILHSYAGLDYSGYNGDGIPATDAALYFVTFLALDSAYNLYLSDNLNYRIRSINNTEGIKFQPPQRTNILTACPNPASNTGKFDVHYALPVVEQATLKLTDVKGRMVREIDLPSADSGTIKMTLPYPGMYFLTLICGTFSQTIKIVY
jgi:hypothetical protein